MNHLTIFCDEYDFSRLAEAFADEFVCDVPTALEALIVDQEEIRRLNREYRDTDRPTDVLSFPTLDGICGREIKGEDFPYDTDENGNLFLGSVVICEQIAREQAEEYGHSYERELHYLAAHGVCHLLGYDHIREEDRKAMRAKEEKVLAKLGLTRE